MAKISKKQAESLEKIFRRIDRAMLDIVKVATGIKKKRAARKLWDAGCPPDWDQGCRGR